MQSVARRIVDRDVLRLIKAWLTAPVEERDEKGVLGSILVDDTPLAHVRAGRVAGAAGGRVPGFLPLRIFAPSRQSVWATSRDWTMSLQWSRLSIGRAPPTSSPV